MMKQFFAVAFASALLALVPQLWAETVEYPDGTPLFTVEVPDGWQVHKESDGALIIQNEDASVVAVFDSRIKGVKDFATQKEAVTLQTKRTAETTGYTDLREIEPVQKMQLSEKITSVGAKYHAKFPTGEPCIYIVAIFAPKGSKYCSMEMSIKVAALLPAVEKEWKALIDSITPAEGEAAEK